jgi:hypothetical protein
MRHHVLHTVNAISNSRQYRDAHDKAPSEVLCAMRSNAHASKTISVSRRLIKNSVAVLLLVCRQVAKFWLISPLGSVDQIRDIRSDNFGRRHFL